MFYEEGRFAAAGYVHLACASVYFETIEIIPRVKRFSPTLTDEDLKTIETELQAIMPPG